MLFATVQESTTLWERSCTSATNDDSQPCGVIRQRTYWSQLEVKPLLRSLHDLPTYAGLTLDLVHLTQS